MPTYTFGCGECEKKQDVVRSISDRSTGFKCACGGWMSRRPELFMVDTFEAHYDEGAGRNFHTKREKQKFLKEKGWVEAGDPIGGARNFDSTAPSTIGRLPVKDEASKMSAGEIEDRREGQIIETVDADGKTVSKERFGDLGGLESVKWNRKKGGIEEAKQ